MKQTARIISTYSADAFGVCSALFELGGMTVMHDASGCNSTYTTHDEPRWFDMDSMVFISGLSEIEAIMGDDDKLIDDIAEAASNLHPEFIAICGTPIPMMTGFDYKAVAEVIEMRTGIPTFGFPTSGMNTYIYGASMAFAGIAERLVDDVTELDVARPLGIILRNNDGSSPALLENIRVNILGMTPLDFSIAGCEKSIRTWLESNNFDVISNWAMGSSLEELRRAGRADVNLVVSAAGLGAAEVLYRRFGIPYVIGLPIGTDQQEMIRDALHEAAFESRAVRHSNHPDERAGTESIGILSDLADGMESLADGRELYADERELHTDGRELHADERELHTDGMERSDALTDVVVIGEGITSLALASAIEFETGRITKVLCATECPEDILRECDRITPDEDDIIPELEGAKVIIADPMYKPICPESAKFISLPSEGFSGRIYRKEIPDLIKSPETIIGQL